MFVVKDIMEDLPSNWGRIVTVLTLYVELKKQAFYTRNKQVTNANIREKCKGGLSLLKRVKKLAHGVHKTC